MKIAIISQNFPHPRFPQSGAFLLNLVNAWANAQADIKVYALISATHLWIRKRGQAAVTLTFQDNIEVRYIRYLSFGRYQVFGCNMADLNFMLAYRVIVGAFEKELSLDEAPDVLYGKFLMSGGRHAARLRQRYGIPAFADCGESKLLENLSGGRLSEARAIIDQLSGIICVSPRLRREVIQLGMDPARILMIPNAVDATKFYPLDKKTVRDQLGLPHDVKIVIFVGHFIHRKGPDRLLQAMDSLPPDYRCVLLGEGVMRLGGPRTLFSGRVPNHELNEWLNAADVFCLPTLAEGCCNAIEEARAVGLPIVTSNIPDITDFDNSKSYILVDPMSVTDIRNGIEQAVSSGNGTFESPSFDISQRSKKILKWIQDIAG